MRKIPIYYASKPGERLGWIANTQDLGFDKHAHDPIRYFVTLALKREDEFEPLQTIQAEFVTLDGVRALKLPDSVSLEQLKLVENFTEDRGELGP